MTRHLGIGRSSPFLATTALEEFWDTSGLIVFLGEWCLRFSRESCWKPLERELLSSPWSDRQRLDVACQEVSAAYEKYLPRLARAMNQIHNVERSDRYWRIVLGPWLSSYLSSVFDRFESVRCARETYPLFRTIVLEEESFVTPRDTLEFAYFVREDAYNLQLYSRIFKALCLDFPSRSLSAEEFVGLGKSRILANKSKLRLLAKAFLARIFEWGQERAPVIIKATYFPFVEELKLIWMSKGAVWPNKTPPASVPAHAKDVASREIVGLMLPNDSDFDQVCGTMLPHDLPQCFVEGFKGLAVEAASRYPSRPNAILSANAWYFDEAFKCWAAEASERGTKLLGAQHGGNYGSLDPMPAEDHETAITDCYFSWGWEREGRPATVVPLPAAKLAGRCHCSKGKAAGSILYAATAAPRYLRQFPVSPHEFSIYLEWQSRFILSLAPELRKKLRVRLHYEDHGWDIKERWRRDMPEVYFESSDLHFGDSLDSCRLYVCDHLSTTFIEALVQDKPTILYWRSESNRLRAEALPLYDQLREVGILHDSPETAAMAVITRYEDIELWWGGNRCRQARHDFCERFGRTSSDALQDWMQMLGCFARNSRLDTAQGYERKMNDRKLEKDFK